MRVTVVFCTACLLSSCSVITSFDHTSKRVRRDLAKDDTSLQSLYDLCDTVCVVDDWNHVDRGGTTHADFPVRLKDQYEVVRVSGQRTRNWWNSIDLSSIVAVPLGGLYELGRWVFLEDFESVFQGVSYDNYILYPKNGPKTFTADTEFEIVFRYLAIDSFLEGRLRDSWGGQGGEISLQASIHALSPRGQLLAEDADFLVTEEIRRRSPLMAALRATEKGRDLVSVIETQATNVLEQVSDYKAEVDTFFDTVTDAVNNPDFDAALDKLRSDLAQAIADNIDNDDYQRVAQFLADRLVSLGKELIDEQVTPRAQNEFVAARDELLTAVNAAAAFFDRYGIDEHGLYEEVEIIRGLADADHSTHLEFEGVRPELFRLYHSEDHAGTAEIAFHDNPPADQDKRYEITPSKDASPRISNKGLVYRGTLKELSKLGPDSKGFSLSVLMLERDSDKVAEALRFIEQYAAERDLEIGGTGVEAAAIADALALIAEKIAEDDVELKCLDLRFALDSLESGGSPGTEVFRLQPCTIVVGRNVEGAEFSALSVIDIRVKDS